MKKILFVCNTQHYPHGAFEFIKQLRQQESLFVKGIFFTPATPSGTAPLPEDNSPERFVNQCKSHDIDYRVVEKNDDAWSRSFWVRETHYADLLVFSQELLYAGADKVQPNAYMQELLHWTGCPAIAVRENGHPPEQLIAAYDGTRQSIEALRSFCTLFPQYKKLPAQIIYVKDEPSNRIPHRQLLEEYAAAHFATLKILKLHWSSKKHFTTWIECFKNPLLIAGAYGRPALSVAFRNSFVETTIRNQLATVFIAR
ncbi:hypothetical protein [Niabella beijingensis]|uniref:hypothetical protein n=1 Tax=Niabella beijingensis TaxID=2872700 RepID=UPI001CC09929|nr:hypothetical protein [Niabella beijingensis]MBZ4191319.1 hypothetical protein [Niabella beijingensis]